MEIIKAIFIPENEEVKTNSYRIRCFTEEPRKTGEEEPLTRIGAFDLFNLFTADIIRTKEVFTR